MSVIICNIKLLQKPPSYLDSFKNPCFTERSLRSLNHHTLQHIYLLRCLPYFFVAGFTKCGTTDFHARLSQHALVTSGWTKEPHWWDNMHGKSEFDFLVTKCKNLSHHLMPVYGVYSKTLRSVGPAT